MTNIVDSLDRYVIGRFPTRAALTAAIPSPTEGMVAYVADTGSFSKPQMMVWMAGAWISLESLLTRQFSFLDYIENVNLGGVGPAKLPNNMLTTDWTRIGSHVAIWTPPFPVRMHMQGLGYWINSYTGGGTQELDMQYLASDNSGKITEVRQWAGTGQNHMRFNSSVPGDVQAAVINGRRDYTAGQQAGYFLELAQLNTAICYTQITTKIWFEPLGVP
jgi:hypothetical protein